MIEMCVISVEPDIKKKHFFYFHLSWRALWYSGAPGHVLRLSIWWNRFGTVGVTKKTM